MNTSTEIEMSTGELRKFGLSTGMVFAVLFGMAIPWIWYLNYPLWPWVILLVLGGLGVIAPQSLRLVHKYWMKFALLISKVTTPIILEVVFFLVIAPVGLIRQMFGDSLNRDFSADAKTYRIDTDKKSTDSLEKPY